MAGLAASSPVFGHPNLKKLSFQSMHDAAAGFKKYLARKPPGSGAGWKDRPRVRPAMLVRPLCPAGGRPAAWGKENRPKN